MYGHGKHRRTAQAATYRGRSSRAAQLLRALFPEMDATVRLCYADDAARRMYFRDRRAARAAA